MSGPQRESTPSRRDGSLTSIDSGDGSSTMSASTHTSTSNGRLAAYQLTKEVCLGNREPASADWYVETDPSVTDIVDAFRYAAQWVLARSPPQGTGRADQQQRYGALQKLLDDIPAGAGWTKGPPVTTFKYLFWVIVMVKRMRTEPSYV